MEREQFNRLLVNPVLLNKETVDGLKALVEEHPSFQTAWILYLKNLKQIKSPDFDEVLEKVAVLITDRKKLYKFLNTNFHNKHTGVGLGNTVPPAYRLGGEGDPGQGNSLIDKFLLADPGAIRQNNQEKTRGENTLAKEVAEHSVAENDEIITETLANIYLQQNNYVKAQEAYRKLSLKYPEKSVYFATRIKEIENLKNI